MGRHSRNSVAPPAPREASGRHRGRRRRHSPVRTGLLASSAALAVGAVAMGAGVLPAQTGGSTSTTALDGSRTPGIPIDADRSAEPNASASSPVTTPEERESAQPSRGRHRGAPDPAESAAAPETPRSPSASAPSRTTEPAAPTEPAPSSPSAPEAIAPTQEPDLPGNSGDPGDTGQEKSAEATVLGLVNAERAKAGCDPVASDPALAQLAEDFSADMAARDFFDHVTPDGLDPWDRAEAAGIPLLGGENIARGQTTAQDVMDSWMASEGHRANILNCDYKTLGVGVEFADGGPWWTQDFGF